MSETPWKLIVGLGNPGPRYARTRHNIGFMVIDELAARYGFALNRTEQRALTAHGQIAGQRVILAKPQTWMNDSGQAVAPLLRYYRLAPAQLLVISDHLDLEFGKVRYRFNSSSGGQRGLQSIIQQLGTQAFGQLRMGIGRPPGQMDPADYVLQAFGAEQEPVVWEMVRAAVEFIPTWLQAPDPAALGTTIVIPKTL